MIITDDDAKIKTAGATSVWSWPPRPAHTAECLQVGKIKSGANLEFVIFCHISFFHLQRSGYGEGPAPK